MMHPSGPSFEADIPQSLRKRVVHEFDCHLSLSPPLPQVVGFLREAFAQHGASPMTSTALGFVDPTTIPVDAVALLTSSGHTVGSRYELRRPFAKWVGLQAAGLVANGQPEVAALEYLRRYEASACGDGTGWSEGEVH